jgi:DNA replication and repair protein RecF
MKVEKLTLRNFRNVRDSTLFPDSSINFLVGANGQGKTSFIEALGFLSTLRSFRNAKAASVIQWGNLKSDIFCTLTNTDQSLGNWNTDLHIQFQMPELLSQKGTQLAYINGKPYKSSTQYLSQRFGSYEMGFHSIIFNPSDHDLVRGEPAIRRAYLDHVVAAEDVEYLKILQKYKRVLEQRNALLKSQESVPTEVLHGFTEPLVRYGAQLALKRLEWINRLAQPLLKILNHIAPRQSDLRLSYFSNWIPSIENLCFNNKQLHSIHFAGQGGLPSLELLEQVFWTKILAAEALERRTGHSWIGPHRDDWAFFMGNQPLRGYGSQGEVRSSLLALKLSEIELFRNKTGHRPLFLLDDFSSELDHERRSFLLQFLKETDLQTFVTTTEDSFFVGKRYWVSNGVIEEGRHDDRTEASRLG